VCVNSIMRHASKPVSVMPIMLSQLDGACVPDAMGSTEFSLSRFLTPYLTRATVSMFVDCDFLFLDDVWKLYDIARAQPYADVLCVQHDYTPKAAVKFLGHEQHTYPRKNWSSLMLFNAHRSCVRLLTPEKVRSLTPGQLHRMAWASAVGALPAEWNWLVGEYADRDVSELHALHYTLGGPWFGVDSAYADLWRRELAGITGGMT
jgi:hypothetical protein